MRRPLSLLFVVLPALLGADARSPLRAQLLPDLDAARRSAILGEAAQELGPEALRQVAEAIRVRDQLTSHGVQDPVVVAAYVDAALSADPAVRGLASRGSAWGGRLTEAGAIDAPTDVQLAAWRDVRLEVTAVVWAVRSTEAEARWSALTSATRDEATVDPQVSGFEGPNFGKPGFPLSGWTVTRGGERLTEARVVNPLLGQPADACVGPPVVLAYEVTGARKARLVAAVALSPAGGAGGPAMVVECGATGVPDRPAAGGGGPRVRWPCATDALDPTAYLPVEVTLPARVDACLERPAVDALVAAANTAALRPLGMERFRVPPLSLPEVVVPTVVDPSLDPASFADPD